MSKFLSLKHLLLLAAVSLACLSASAQSFALYGGPVYVQRNFKPGGLNELTESYNAYQQANSAVGLASGLEPFSGSMSGLGWMIGAEGNANKLAFAFEMDLVKLSQTRTSLFTTNWGRELVFEFDDFTFDAMMGAGEKAKIMGVFGGTFRNVAMNSYQVYPDGSRSIGSEYYFNGRYRGFQAGLNVGAAFSLNLTKFAALRLKAVWQSDLLNFTPPEDAYLTALGDPKKVVLTSEYLPKDFGQYISDVNQGIYDFEENVIPTLFYGLQLSGALVVRIPYSLD